MTRAVRRLAAGALVIASVAMGACGSSEEPTILSTEKVERAIEKSSLDQRGVVARVSCPDGVHQKEGLEFSCTAVADGGRREFAVTVLDDGGQVHYEVR